MVLRLYRRGVHAVPVSDHPAEHVRRHRLHERVRLSFKPRTTRPLRPSLAQDVVHQRGTSNGHSLPTRRTLLRRLQHPRGRDRLGRRRRRVVCGFAGVGKRSGMGDRSRYDGLVDDAVVLIGSSDDDDGDTDARVRYRGFSWLAMHIRRQCHVASRGSESIKTEAKPNSACRRRRTRLRARGLRVSIRRRPPTDCRHSLLPPSPSPSRSPPSSSSLLLPSVSRRPSVQPALRCYRRCRFPTPTSRDSASKLLPSPSDLLQKGELINKGSSRG